MRRPLPCVACCSLLPFCVGCYSVLPLCVAWSSALAARLVASRWSSAATPLPAAALSRCPQPATTLSGCPLPAASCSVASPGQQQLSHHGAPASSSSVTVSTASSIFPMALRCSAPASNKPHLAEKSTPVWLAIWRTWAGFANSQHRDAAFATPDNICAHSSLLQH